MKQDNQSKVLGELGTASAANYSEYLGAMPAKYYHQGAFPAVDNISGSKVAETILVGQSACRGCVIACGRVVDRATANAAKVQNMKRRLGLVPTC
ncbi:MAG: hypothetical protein HND47_11230 [Chloroflexi bacterium]|nr:hypothetical protein [Chloroflexota bacterium]